MENKEFYSDNKENSKLMKSYIKPACENVFTTITHLIAMTAPNGGGGGGGGDVKHINDEDLAELEEFEQFIAESENVPVEKNSLW